MFFSSNIFLFMFLPMVLMLYYNPFCRGRKFRNVLLLLASLFFYAWGEPLFVWLMIISIIAGWQAGLKITKADSPCERKLWLTLGTIFHLGMLFVFNIHLLIPPAHRRPHCTLCRH